MLPQIRKHITLEEFPFIIARSENPAWTENALRDRIIDLGPWEYHFTFSHGLTTRINSTYSDGTIDFHRFRSKLISETVVDILGQELGNSTVIDLACHCGVFSLDVAFRGARSALGVELRRKNLEQAEFLKEYYRIHNSKFEQGDVYQLDQDMKADVVLCLGILYHVVRPVDLIEFCYHNAQKFAVIETLCEKQPISAYHVVRGKDPKIAIEGTRSIELLPTYRAVIDTMREVGFKDIIEVVGTSDKPVELFSDHTRRCLIGFKEGYNREPKSSPNPV